MGQAVVVDVAQRHRAARHAGQVKPLRKQVILPAGQDTVVPDKQQAPERIHCVTPVHNDKYNTFS